MMAGTGLGYIESSRLARRVEVLDQTLRFLQFVRTGVRYSARPVEELLTQSAAQFPALPQLARCGVLLRRGIPFREAWKKSLEEMKKQSRMEAVYFQTSEEFGHDFGVTDAEGQLAHFDLYRLRYEEQLAEAREQYKRKGRLYILLGGLSGLAAALLFI